VHLFWGDERCVPPDHAESNYRMVQEALLSRISIPPENIRRMAGEKEPRVAPKQRTCAIPLRTHSPTDS
jgi:6-phosphogluconolactonase